MGADWSITKCKALIGMKLNYFNKRKNEMKDYEKEALETAQKLDSLIKENGDHKLGAYVLTRIAARLAVDNNSTDFEIKGPINGHEITVTVSIDEDSEE